jgi:hypothetical protein
MSSESVCDGVCINEKHCLTHDWSEVYIIHYQLAASGFHKYFKNLLDVQMYDILFCPEVATILQ